MCILGIFELSTSLKKDKNNVWSVLPSDESFRGRSSFWLSVSYRMEEVGHSESSPVSCDVHWLCCDCLAQNKVAFRLFHVFLLSNSGTERTMMFPHLSLLTLFL